MRLRLLTAALPLALSISSAADPIAWPEGQKAAVSLSYDDALNSQLDNAAPALQRHSIKASFYPTLSSPAIAERLDEWRELAEAGYEFGNHTLFHPCRASLPGMDWVKPYNNLDKRTVEQMQTEVATANSFLHAIDGKTRRTMTPPCGHRQTADGDYIDAVSDRFVAIKGWESLPEGATHQWAPTGQTGDELIAFVKKAARDGGVVNIIFHGIGGDYLSNSSQAHEKLVTFLAEHRDTYWTDTYINIMTYANEQ